VAPGGDQVEPERGFTGGRGLLGVDGAGRKSEVQPSTTDIADKIRRAIIAARFNPSRPGQPPREEISAVY